MTPNPGINLSAQEMTAKLNEFFASLHHAGYNVPAQVTVIWDGDGHVLVSGNVLNRAHLLRILALGVDTSVTAAVREHGEEVFGHTGIPGIDERMHG